MKRFFTVAFLLVGFLVAEAQDITWASKNGPYGGQIVSIAVNSTKGSAYAISSSGFLFRLGSSEDSWTDLRPQVFKDNGDISALVEVMISSDGTVWILGKSALYKSTDDGATFVKANTSAISNPVTMHENVFNHNMYIVGYSQSDGHYAVYRSTNVGSTWTKQFVATGGQYFTKLVSDMAGNVYALDAQFSNYHLNKSTNNGTTFVEQTTVTDYSVVEDITSKSDGSEVTFITGTSTIWTTTNFNTWTAVGETGITNVNSYGPRARISYTPDNSMLLLADNNEGKFYTKSGSTWTPRATEFPSSDLDFALCITALDNTNFFVGTNQEGVWRSTTTGNGWEDISAGIKALVSNGGLGSNSNGTMVVADNGNVIAAYTKPYMMNADDGTWSRPVVSTYLYSIYSVIKGQNGPQPRPIVLLSSQANNSADLVSFRSIDNGNSWTATTRSPSNNFATSDGINILAYDGIATWFSTDQGDSWQDVNITGLPTSYQYQYLVMDGNATPNVYAALYDRTDPQTTVLRFFKIALNSASPTSGTASEIQLSTIGVDYIYDMICNNNTVYVLGQGNNNRIISVTSNGGTTWTKNSSPSSNADNLDFDRDSGYIFAVTNSSTGYRIFISRDNAVTFTPSDIKIDGTRSRFAAMAIDPGTGKAYASFESETVYGTAKSIVLPAPPSNISVSALFSDRLVLKWTDNAANENDFFVKQVKGQTSITANSTGSLTGTGAVQMAEVGNLSPGTQYTFYVYAQNEAGKSDSLKIDIATSAACTTTIPDNHSWDGTVVTGTGPTSLTNVAIVYQGANLYTISDVSNGAISTCSSGSISTLFEEGCGKTYLYGERNLFSDGLGTWDSGTKTLTLKWVTDSNCGAIPVNGLVTLTLNDNDPLPGKPTSLSAVSLTNTSIEVSWTGSLFALSYKIERSKDNFSTIEQTFNADYPSTKFIDNTGLVIGTKYYYRITAQNKLGNAAADNPTTVTFSKPMFVLSGTAVETVDKANTAGAYWGDFNNDGFDDLFLTKFQILPGTETIPYIFKNDGAGGFTLLTNTGIEASFMLSGSLADYDNDGNLDAFFSSHGTQNYLYKGNGDFTFTKVSTPMDANFPDEFEKENLANVWVDTNNDGRLDLVTYPQDSTIGLFLQQSNGSFTLQAPATGNLASIPVTGALAIWADYDNDGDQDVFMPERDDTTPNQLYKNNGDGTFTQITAAPFNDVTRGYGAAWGDYNNDGNLDLFVGAQDDSDPQPNELYKNNGDGTFTKQSLAPITSDRDPLDKSQPYASIWADVNNDMYLDLIVANVQGPNAIFINHNGTSFTQVLNEKFTDPNIFDFAVATSDYDRNGFLDIAMSQIDQLGFETEIPSRVTPMLFKNTNTTGNWIELKLKGTVSNRGAIGARVTLIANGTKQIREIQSTTTFISESSQVVHFGLGSATSITSLQIKWPSGIIQNIPAPAINTYQVIVEDNTGPVIAIQTPANSASGINFATTIAISLDEVSTAIAGKKLSIREQNTTTDLASIDMTSAAVSNGTTYTFTLANPLSPAKTYEIKIDAGAFTDTYGNLSLALAYGTWSFTTKPALAINIQSPANNSTGIDFTTTLVITLSEAGTLVAGKKITVLPSGGTSDQAVSLEVNTAAVSGNTYTFTLPNALTPLTAYQVSIDAGAFTDAFGNPSSAIDASAWKFTTKEGLDVTAPVITFTASTATSKSSLPTSFVATITDNKAVGAASLFYRPISGPTFTEAAGTVTNAATGEYTFAFGASGFDATGIEYYFTAKDNATTPNTTRSPAGTSNYATYVKYASTDAKVPSNLIGTGGTKASWKVISIPFEPSNKDVSAIFEELTSSSTLVNKKDYRLITYKNATAWAEYPADFTQFNRGVGYFINLKTATELSIGDNLVPPSNTRTNLFKINLAAGWNMIGNPYLTGIQWSDVATLNGLSGSDAKLVKYVSGSYVENASLAAYEGGFVFMAAAKSDVQIPFAGETSAGRTYEVPLEDGEFEIPITLQIGDVTNPFGGVGMRKIADESFDIFDNVNAPRFFDYAEMNFSHPEHFALAFARDVVPMQPEYQWNFSVAANVNEIGTFTWNLQSITIDDADLLLYDPATQTVVDMKTTTSFSFDRNVSSTFSIYYGKDAINKIKPQHVLLGAAFPNPSSGLVTIPFSIPEKGSKANVRLEVFDMMGRKIGTLAQGEFDGGFFRREWMTDETVTNGIYIYRLVVGGEVQSGKVLIKK
jgi:hypothetical protein